MDKKQGIRRIVVTTTFPAIHCWPECPLDGVSFLRHPHRHLFYVTIKMDVNHNDRDIEFLTLKREVETFIRKHYWDKDLGRTSCEVLCEQLATVFGAQFVSVYEDNENGAEFIPTP